MQRDIGKPLFDLMLLVASAAAFAFATTLPNVRIPGDISPAFFPKMLSALIFICVIPCLIKDAREWLCAEKKEYKRDFRGVWQWLFIVGLALVYIVSFEALGYVPSTALFCFFCVVGLSFISGIWRELDGLTKLKSVGGTAVFSIVLSISIYFVFTEVFRIPLPS